MIFMVKEDKNALVSEPNDQEHVDNHVSYNSIVRRKLNSGETLKIASQRERVLGRLEGFMLAGFTVDKDILEKVLEEFKPSYDEIHLLADAQAQGVRTGISLNYTNPKDVMRTYGERAGNIAILAQYAMEKLQGAKLK